MTHDSIYYIVVLIILAAAFLILLAFRRKPKRRTSVQNDYIAGLHFLLWGDQDRALEKFRDVVRRDTDFIDAYILIGNIFREKGSFENAVKVHRDLLVRPNLPLEQQKNILMNLSQDYYKNGQLKWAQSTCDKIIELDKKDEWAKEFKLTIFEGMGDWQGAFEILRKHSRFAKPARVARLALYKVEQGLQLAALNQEHEARLRYREALKWDEKCFPAFVELAQSYFREKKEEEALTELQRLLQALPEYADVALNTFENVLFEMGRFDEIEKFYRQIVESHPHLIEAYLGLAEIYEKKGELLKAVDLCNQALTHSEDNQKVKLMLIRLNSRLERFEAVAKLANEIAETVLTRKKDFVCSQCDFRRESFFWNCPSCHAWNSAVRK
jgi:lipopolysaccharide assembly protein B